LKTTLMEINKEAAKFFFYQLRGQEGTAAREYLMNRELTDDTIKKFGLGYSDKYSNSLYKYIKGKGYSDELLNISGLFNVDEKRGMYDKFWNRVIFPIMDVNNRVIGFGGRVMGDAKPKYLNSPETKIFDKSRNLYGLNLARTSRKKNLIICEGYMDVIAMHQAGFTNAVASLGTALTTQQAALMKRYTDEVLIIYDSDDAGVKAAQRAIPILKAANLSTKVVNLRPYKDPDEFIKNLGAEEFESRLEHAQNSFLYQIEAMQRQFDMSDPQGKTDFHNAVAEKLLEFPEEIERNNYMEAVSREYHIVYEDLRKLVNRKAMKGLPGENYQKPKSGINSRKEKETGMEKSQKLMLTWLANYPGVFPVVKDYISPEDFTVPLYHEVALLLYEQYEKEGQVNPAKLLNRFTDGESQTKVNALFHAELHLESEAQRDQAVTDTVFRMKKNRLDTSLAQLDPTDIVGLQQILAGKKELEQLERNNQLLHISFN
ncbi:MAG: DNA primase, partial [Lachnospiraceae bacterium]|nr:DNA primase [Lachnospiraceae bacterium]